MSSVTLLTLLFPKKKLRSLLLTLCTRKGNPTTDCSKAPWGLRFPLEVFGLCTKMLRSPGSILRQWKTHYSIHAGRQLTGKGLRYLKIVRVTTAVYQSFAPLNRSFRYWHWARSTDYTNLCRLAVSYVFDKQLGFPCY